MTFVKLDAGILDSSLWLEDLPTRITFLSMLAMAGADGVVRATAPGIARRANLPLTDVRSSLARLEAPDPDSRSPESDGRRIVRVDGGYRLVNYLRYRAQSLSGAERQRGYRSRHSELRDVTASDETLRDVTDVTHIEEEEEEEVEVEAEADRTAATARARIEIPIPVQMDEVNAQILDVAGQIATIRDEDTSETLKRNSMAHGRWIANLDSAKYEWRVRTLHDLRSELDRIKAAQREGRPISSVPKGRDSPQEKRGLEAARAGMSSWLAEEEAREVSDGKA